MKTKFLKYLSITLAVLVLLTMVSACNTQSKEVDEKKPTADELPKSSTETKYPDLEEHVHFDDIYHDKPEDLEAHDAYVSEKLGRKYTTFSVPTATYYEKLNTMLLAGDFPDSMELSEHPFNFVQHIQQGHLIPITDYLNNSPKLSYIMENFSSVFERYTVDGEIYGFPQSKYDLKVIWIREDWLNNLGLNMPVTTDDYYEVLKAFTFNDPDKNGLDDTIGMVNAKYVHDLLPIFYAFGADYYFKEDKNGMIYDGFTELKSELQEAMDYIKKLMDDGVFEREWPTTTNSMQRQKSWSGFNGTVIYWDGRAEEYNRETREKDPNANWDMIPTLKGPRGDQGIFENGLGSPWAITVGCKNPDQAFELFEFYFGEEGTYLTSYGPPAYAYKDTKYAAENANWDIKGGEFVRTAYGEERGFGTFYNPAKYYAGFFEPPIKGEVNVDIQRWIDMRPTLDKLTVVQGYITMENDWYAGTAGLIKGKKEELITKYLFGEYDLDTVYKEWDDWWGKLNGPINLEKINAARKAEKK